LSHVSKTKLQMLERLQPYWAQSFLANFACTQLIFGFLWTQINFNLKYTGRTRMSSFNGVVKQAITSYN